MACAIYGCMWKIEVPWTACRSWAAQIGRQGQKKLSHWSKGKKSLLGPPPPPPPPRGKTKITFGGPTPPQPPQLFYLGDRSYCIQSNKNNNKQNPDIDSHLEYEHKILIFEVWSTLALKMAATMFRCFILHVPKIACLCYQILTGTALQ